MREKLDGKGRLKATMLKAHLAWAEQETDQVAGKLEAKLDDEASAFLKVAMLATEWIPFRSAMQIDRAIAEIVGGPLDDVLRQMGRHSAAVNLGGVYKIFVKEEPHRFFTRMTTLHRRFQSFGEPAYEQTGEHCGRIRIEDCEEYSKTYCWSALGYYEGALEMMKVPGPVTAAEVSCQCQGDPNCVFELAWSRQ